MPSKNARTWPADDFPCPHCGCCRGFMPHFIDENTGEWEYHFDVYAAYKTDNQLASVRKDHNFDLCFWCGETVS